MQNTQTLIELGFQKNPHGEYFWRSRDRVVIVGREIDFNGPRSFVELFLVSNKVDTRPNSDRKGRHYQRLIKQCCSVGSVERVLKSYEP